MGVTGRWVPGPCGNFFLSAGFRIYSNTLSSVINKHAHTLFSQPLLTHGSRPLLDCRAVMLRIGQSKTWRTQTEFCTWQNSVTEQQPPKCIYSLPAQVTAKHCVKFGWLPLSDVAAVMKPRCESPSVLSKHFFMAEQWTPWLKPTRDVTYWPSPSSFTKVQLCQAVKSSIN